MSLYTRTRLRAAKQAGAITLFVTEQWDHTNQFASPEVKGAYLLNLGGSFVQLTHMTVWPQRNDKLRTDILQPALLSPGERLDVLDHAWFQHLEDLRANHISVPEFPRSERVGLTVEFHVVTPEGPSMLAIVVLVKHSETGLALSLPDDQ